MGYLTNIHWKNKIPLEQVLSDIGGSVDECGGMNGFGSRQIPKAFSNNLPNWNPEEAETDSENGYQILYQGNPFYLIATVPAYHYGCDGADSILLMYEPIRRIVLFTYDWT